MNTIILSGSSEMPSNKICVRGPSRKQKTHSGWVLKKVNKGTIVKGKEKNKGQCRTLGIAITQGVATILRLEELKSGSSKNPWREL